MSLYASVYMCFVVTCWEMADLLALVCGVCCEFVTFPMVSWVRCGTWLYRFLIFPPLLTLISISTASAAPPDVKHDLDYWLSCMRWFLVFLSLSHAVSWVGCGTWLYRFLIFPPLLTLISISTASAAPPDVKHDLYSWLSCMRWFLVFLSLSHVVSWVRCGTWYYQFLISVLFLTCSCKREG